MRWSPIFSWLLVILFGLILAVAPASATPARLGSPNIPSSVLLNVAELIRERAEARSERPSEERSKETVDALSRAFNLGEPPVPRPGIGDAPLRLRVAPAPLERKLGPAHQEKSGSALRGLKRTYDNDTRTYDDTPKHNFAKEPDPPLEVHKQSTVDDTVEDHENGKKQEKQKEQETRCTATTLNGHTQEGYCYHGDDGILRFRPD